MSQSLTILSHVIGWMYFFAWSISFYPQLLTNYQLKHIHGYSLDFVILNVTGFTAYSIYSIWGFCHPGIMPGIVDIQDIAFGVHALLLTLVTLGQCYHYDVIYTQKTIWKTGIHKITKIANLVMWVVAIIIASIELGGAMPHAKSWNGCLFLGYLKVLVSLTKNMPQVYLNYSRKSTVGLSILNILLDFIGGILSIFQIFVDGANTGDWNVFGDGGAFNIAKFCLGFISIFFDIIFMLQHYVFYRHKESHKESCLNTLLPMDDSSDKTRV